MTDQPPIKPLPFFIATGEQVLEVPHVGQRLMIMLQLRGPGGMPMSSVIELPGDTLVTAIEALQAIVDAHPHLTKDLVGGMRPMTPEECQEIQRASQVSEIVDHAGQPIRGNGKLKLVN